MRPIFLFTILLILDVNSYGQKLTGMGAELSVAGLHPNVRWWLSRTAGFEVFGGVAAELEDFKPNDFEGGLKYLNTIIYDRTHRTYFGLMGKWKWVNVETENSANINLPIVGALIGKEWFRNRGSISAFAIELGYQYGTKDYEIYSKANNVIVGRKKFKEFPLILNFRYSFYKMR